MGDRDRPVKFLEKLLQFGSVHWRGVVCLITPLILLPIIVPRPENQYRYVAYTLCVMAVYWVAEAIPLPCTAFIPIVIFPLFNVMEGDKVCAGYINGTVFVFIGSLMLAAAVEQSGLHNRMALAAVRTIGYSHYKLLFAMCFMTMFVSMWLTNTAATTMMVPIIFALLRVFEDQGLLQIFSKNEIGDDEATKLTTCYFCATTFSATIGGIGTLIGTGTNLVFKGLFETTYPEAPEYLSFPLFSAFTVPYMIVMEAFLYMALILQYLGFLRPNSNAASAVKIPDSAIKAAKQAVAKKTDDLGPITFWEVMVLILFSFTIVLFFTLSPQMFPGWGDKIIVFFDAKPKYVRDQSVAMLGLTLMWYLPRSLAIFRNCTAKTVEQLPKGKVLSVLDWVPMERVLPWSFMFLFGGGFSIAAAAGKSYTNFNGVIGDYLSNLSILPSLFVLLLIIIITVFITNFASNVAVATVIVPIGMTLATRLQANPLQYNLATGLSASYCFMLPVGTPGNLVVQGAAKVTTKQMLIAGFLPTVTTIFWTWFFLVTYAPVIWPDMKKSPDDLSWTNVTAKKG